MSVLDVLIVKSPVLTRGIYKKADLEEKIGEKRKYAGGAVAVGLVGPGGIAALNGIAMVGNPA